MTISTKKPLYAEVHNVPDNYEFTNEELNRIIAGDMFTPRQDAIMAREIQKLRAAMLHGADGILTNEDTKRVGELVMWIKRLAHSLRKSNPDSKLQSDAMDYLSRKGLIGVKDILR